MDRLIQTTGIPGIRKEAMVRPSKLLACALGAVLLSFGCGRREAGDATYTHAGPAFRVTYPEAWKPEKPRYANEAFRATDPSSLPTFAVSLYPGTPPAYVDEHYPEKFVAGLKALFPRASDYKVVASQMVTLADGTRASEVTCEWTWEDGATRLASCNRSAVKDNTLVSVTSTAVPGLPAGILEKVPRSLAFGN
jgi:hypothetical protein